MKPLHSEALIRYLDIRLFRTRVGLKRSGGTIKTDLISSFKGEDDYYTIHYKIKGYNKKISGVRVDTGKI